MKKRLHIIIAQILFLVKIVNNDLKMKRKCIVHYKGFSNYSNLKELSQTNKERILLAKEEREKLGGDHYHKEQCELISDDFGENDCIHLEPCYKMYCALQRCLKRNT